MARYKVTLTLDAVTARRLASAAARLAISESEVVRQAIAAIHDRSGRLSECERLALLRTFDEVVPRIEQRDSKQVVRELHAIRKARKRDGRLTAAQPVEDFYRGGKPLAVLADDR